MPIAQTRSRWIASLFCGALLLTACGAEDVTTDASESEETRTPDDAETTEAATPDPESDDTEPATDTAGSDLPQGVALAGGSVTVGEDEYELETAIHCPPTEMFGGDGEIVERTFALTADEMSAVQVWEQVEDGVTSQRVTFDVPGLSSHEMIVAEGEDGYPLYRIEDGRVSFESVHWQDDVPVTASWDLPPDQREEGIC